MLDPGLHKLANQDADMVPPVEEEIVDFTSGTVCLTTQMSPDVMDFVLQISMSDDASAGAVNSANTAASGQDQSMAAVDTASDGVRTNTAQRESETAAEASDVDMVSSSR